MNYRKIAAVVCTAAITTALPGMVFAATGDIPADSKTVEVTIEHLEGVEKVQAYRIVEPNYNEEGFVSFTPVNGISIQDIQNPSKEEIQTIAAQIASKALVPEKSVSMELQTDHSAKASLPAGEYLVLVTDQTNADYLYNPMIVSAYYTDANEADSLVSSGVLNATQESAFYAKRFEIPLDKEIVDADGVSMKDDDSSDGYQADELGIGDTGKFLLRTRFPAYSGAYQANGVQFTLEDTQDDGFDEPTEITVTVQGKKSTAASDTYQLMVNGNDFKVDFASGYVLAHAGEEVLISYKAKLNENCSQKFEPNTDSVKLTYTNSVTDRSKVSTRTDDVEEYTFPVKIQKIAAIDGTDTKGGQPLSGAEFTLTRKNADGKTGTSLHKVITDENGIAVFGGLDEGTYSVEETKSPEGYSINPDKFELTILPEYQVDGSLKQYQVIMKNTTKDTEIGSIVVDSADDDILAGNITDSRLQTLPAAGGNGTMPVTVLAAVLAMLAAACFAGARKRENEKQPKQS